MPPEVEYTRDEISLAEVSDLLASNTRTLWAGAAAALLIAGAYVGLAPARYKATVNVQMATVESEPIETPAVLVEKLKLPLYFSPQSWRVCRTDDELHPSRTLARELSPTVNRNAPFVTLSFVGTSPEVAAACLQTVVQEISEKQAEMSEPLIKLRQANLQALKEKQAEAQAFLKMLPKLKSDMNISDAKFPAVSLLMATGLTKESEIRERQLEIDEAELKLTPPNTQSTTLAAPIYAPNSPTGPAAWMILLAAPLVGLMLTVLLLLLKNALTRPSK